MLEMTLSKTCTIYYCPNNYPNQALLRYKNFMLPNMAVFADNGITGATHGVALRKVLLKEDGFSSSNFITLSGSSIFSILIGLITLVVKYRWPPSIISARFLSSASVIANSNTELLYIDTLHLSFLCKKICEYI